LWVARISSGEAHLMADSRGPKGAPEPAPGSPAAAAGRASDIDPVAVIRSKRYLTALILAGILGIPISAVAYGFLALVATIQRYLFVELPTQVTGGPAPAWWPVPWLVLCGLLTALTIRYLPGNAGHSPAFGFKAGGGPPTGADLVGVILASLSTLGLGAVLGPEAPLIAIGGGLAALVVHLVKKDAPPMALTIMASAGSFAAISTLLGSPILGAFLIMEAAGIGGATLSLVALPGLLASGIGALIFVGLDSFTGLGTFSLALTTVPPQVVPTIATMGWALGMGLVGALLGWGIRWIGLSVRPIVHLNRVLVTAGLGLLIGLLAMGYQLVTGNGFGEVLFSGQDALPGLVAHAADYSLGVLFMLIACKALAYGLSLSAFRGGPVFPSMFIGAAIGIAASGLPGMDLAPAIGMGIGAMCTAMLRLPLTSTLLAILLLGADGLSVTPEIIVAVVVAFVVTNTLPVPGPKEPTVPPAGTRPLGAPPPAPAPA
jgi:chloride channel protein, CIC family